MGFDKKTELIVEDTDITDIGFETAARVLAVPVDDLVYGHDLDADQLTQISELAGLTVHPDTYDYQLGGSAD